MQAKKKNGFTLIELLVVVAIIALLISILLPSLGKARRYARAAACGANLRSITQAMTIYATEWEGAILGNAHTSSAFLYKPDYSGFAPGISESNVPEVISVNDWLTPTARMMGLSFDNGPTQADRINRFMQFNAFKGFTCPENDLVSTAYTGEGGPNFPVHQMLSYVTSLCCQYTQGGNNNQVSINFSTLNLGTYRPRVQLVGSQSDKVFIADGARWFDGTGTVAITTDGSVTGSSSSSPGGMSADYGPWDGFNRSYQFDGGKNGDGRVAAMRHGDRKQGANFQTFRLNLAFFDGHVETMKGLDGADPSLWCPKGTVISSGECVTNSDFILRYGKAPVVR